MKISLRSILFQLPIFAAWLLSSCATVPAMGGSTGYDIETYVFKGQDVKRTFGEADQKLIDAACNNDYSAATVAVGLGANPNSFGNTGLTPLLSMFQCNSPRGMSLLISLGADPDQIDKNGLWLPLAIASYQKDQTYLTALLEAGVDVNNPADLRLNSSSVNGVINAWKGHNNWKNYELLVADGWDVGAFVQGLDQEPSTARSRLHAFFSFGAFCKLQDIVAIGPVNGDELIYKGMKGSIDFAGWPKFRSLQDQNCYRGVLNILETRYKK